MYKVYVWTNAVNGKKYVGTTGMAMEKRAGVNGYYYKGSPRFYSAIQKYGFDNFSYEILADNLTKEQAAEIEKQYIQEFDTMNPAVGYNLQEGGFPDNIPRSNATRVQKISHTLKEQRSSPEYRKIMSERMQKVWDDPERRAEIIRKRKLLGKGGKPKVQVFCDETNTLYPSLREVSEALGFSRSAASSAFSQQGPNAVLRHSKAGPVYHIHKVVHVKEGELPESPAVVSEDNQQPRPDDDFEVQPDLGIW